MSHIFSGIVGAVAAALILHPTSILRPNTAELTHEQSASVRVLHAQGAVGQDPRTDGTAGTQNEAIRRLPPQRSEAQYHDFHMPGYVSPEMADQCIAVAKDINPDLGRRLEMLREHDERGFQLLLRADGRRLIAMAELRSRDTTLYSLKMQELSLDTHIMRMAHDLRQAVARADETAIAGLETELEMMLNLQFALTVGARAQYLLRLEHYVEQLHAEIDDMATNRERLIAERLEELKCSDRPVQPSWQRETPTGSFAYADDLGLSPNPPRGLYDGSPSQPRSDSAPPE